MDNKIHVLTTLLVTRSEGLQAIRDRQLKTIIGSISVFFIVVNWIIQESYTYPLVETIGLIISILAFWIGIILVLKDLKSAYYNNMNIVNRIENSLKLYEPDVYTNDNESLYPKAWKKPIGRQPFFDKFIIILSIFAIISIAALIMKLVLSK